MQECGGKCAATITRHRGLLLLSNNACDLEGGDKMKGGEGGDGREEVMVFWREAEGEEGEGGELSVNRFNCFSWLSGRGGLIDL